MRLTRPFASARPLILPSSSTCLFAHRATFVGVSKKVIRSCVRLSHEARCSVKRLTRAWLRKADDDWTTVTELVAGKKTSVRSNLPSRPCPKHRADAVMEDPCSLTCCGCGAILRGGRRAYHGYEDFSAEPSPLPTRPVGGVRGAIRGLGCRRPPHRGQCDRP